ncbi:MAG: hypothetical protein KDD64_02110 [Bdellovibrionales bacterium]|nr:hypothetical protein [Bdellovibrionales bacterium]
MLGLSRSSNREPTQPVNPKPSARSQEFELSDTLPSGFREVLRGDDPFKRIEQERSERRSREDRERKGSDLPVEQSQTNGVTQVVDCAKNFVAGLIKPFASFVRSPRGFAIGTSTAVGVAVASALAPQIVLPVVVGLGAGITIYEATKFYRMFRNAESPQERAKSFVHLGEAVVAGGLTYFGLKSILGAGALALEEVGLAGLMFEAGESAQIAGEVAEVGVAARLAATEGAAALQESALAAEEGVSSRGIFARAFRGILGRPDAKKVKEILTEEAPEEAKNERSWGAFFREIRAVVRGEGKENPPEREDSAHT